MLDRSPDPSPSEISGSWIACADCEQAIFHGKVQLWSLGFFSVFTNLTVSDTRQQKPPLQEADKYSTLSRFSVMLKRFCSQSCRAQVKASITSERMVSIIHHPELMAGVVSMHMANLPLQLYLTHDLNPREDYYSDARGAGRALAPLAPQWLINTPLISRAGILVKPLTPPSSWCCRNIYKLYCISLAPAPPGQTGCGPMPRHEMPSFTGLIRVTATRYDWYPAFRMSCEDQVPCTGLWWLAGRRSHDASKKSGGSPWRPGQRPPHLRQGSST